MISSSPDRNTFQVSVYKKQLEMDPTDEAARTTIAFYEQWNRESKMIEQDPGWQKENLEYDLRSTPWILEKVRGDDAYAQHLYAALCNNEFQKLDTWPLLTGQTWACSWRSAGGIVANMLEKGDYIDWYCSGMGNKHMDLAEFDNLTIEQKVLYLQYQSYVSEGTVTDEIRDDLHKISWAVVDDLS